MHVYKELSFVGNKPELDKLSEEIYNVFPTDWINLKVIRCLKIIFLLIILERKPLMRRFQFIMEKIHGVRVCLCVIKLSLIHI